ncbi:NEDD4 family-interacting protein 2-like [Dendronephthya gigantea]|uniref:NEDD4 family-interacting protein 2-like n=1 Tax=Dendronephthya gigantea TaxID=151771 RepID=UPI00106C8FD7|nr:NEDD4 family-interacting protein 2-like [Dendronephthya gigantea]
MAESGRYTRLTDSENATESEREPMLNDNDTTPPVPTPSSAPLPTSPPPSYSSSTTEQESPSGINSVDEMPPAYDIAAKLPTYEEAEMTKHSDSRFEPGGVRDPDECRAQLGTDSLFALCFLVSLIFNWIGFIFAYCVTDTVAGRYGALSGFGLSLIKWVFILKHSKCCKDLAFEDAWLWWLIALLGWLVFIRGILVYAQVKKNVRAGHAIYIPRYWGLTRGE